MTRMEDLKRSCVVFNYPTAYWTLEGVNGYGVGLTIQRDSGRWWASTDSEGRLTVVNFCFDSTMLCSVANIAWSV